MFAESYLGLLLQFKVSRQIFCWFSLLRNWRSLATCSECNFFFVFWLVVSARFCFFAYFASRTSLEYLVETLELLLFNVVLWKISTTSVDFFICFNKVDCWRVTPWPAWKVLTEKITERRRIIVIKHLVSIQL